MKQSDWVSLCAVLISVGSAVLSLWQAAIARGAADQAKRSADAAQGDLDPVFEVLDYNSISFWEAHKSADLELLVSNFNRKTLLVLSATLATSVQGIEFSLPSNVQARCTEDQAGGQKVTVFERLPYLTRLPGVSPNSAEPVRASLILSLTFRSVGELVSPELPIKMVVKWQYSNEQGVRESTVCHTALKKGP